MEITSLTNAKVKQWVKYKEKKYRDRDECFLIAGDHLIEEAHRAGLIHYLIYEKSMVNDYPQYDTYQVTSEIMQKISSHVSEVKKMAVCRYPIQNSIVSNRILALDDVQDPGNVGTMIRTAYSFGYRTLLMSEKCADIYNEKVIRSTQGAVFHVTVLRCDLKTKLMELQKDGYHIYGTCLQDASDLQNAAKKEKHVLLMGNEGQGVQPDLLALCDERIHIAMDTFESLNVAVAAGICMYYLRQQ